MVKVCVRDQHRINRRQIFDPYARMAETLKNKQPAGKIRINQNIPSADLNQKAGMSNKCDSQFLLGNRYGFMAFAVARGQGRVLYDAPELAGLFSQSDISHGPFRLDAQNYGMMQIFKHSVFDSVY